MEQSPNKKNTRKHKKTQKNTKKHKKREVVGAGGDLRDVCM